ncbi:MAG: SRPBCC domain-containing protein [Armatimonadetes bacterium]|nr:SRPBCC domain-containing protein [Armatimonadota bacterium]
MQDVIEREIIISAEMDRVYRAISSPDQFASWFSEAVEGTFEVGQQPVIDEGKWGKFRLAIVGAEPPKYFAWRWVSGSAFVPQGFVENPLEHPNTLVEFFLESHPQGTKLKVVETGFASLPESYRQQNFEDNTGGWEYQLARLGRFVETGSPE